MLGGGQESERAVQGQGQNIARRGLGQLQEGVYVLPMIISDRAV